MSAFNGLSGAADMPAHGPDDASRAALRAVREQVDALAPDDDEDSSTVRSWEWDDATALSAPLEARNWLVHGLWPAGSYGALAGEKKTLKSYMALLLAVAVASDRKYLSEFEVDHGAVVYMAAEGGRDQFKLRFQEVCHGYGLIGKARKQIQFHATNYRAQLGSEEFVENIRAALVQWSPKLLVLDSLYNIHPSGVETANLYDRGAMLAEVSDLVREVSGGTCALIIVDHFKKSTGALDLHNVSMSGVAEWVDSWVLQRHRVPFDKANKRARLEVEYGNRYESAEYGVDITLPPHPDKANGRVGAVRWTVQSLTDADAADGRTKREDGAERMRQDYLSRIRHAKDAGMTRTELQRAIPGDNSIRSDVLKALVDEGFVTTAKANRGGRQKVQVYVASFPETGSGELA
ncbi:MULTISPECIES: AAA family ATPase [Gordonia]|uniref:AAA family ATPase n=1 Tax=Gordonia TaxID=2053 RepID=UPI00257FB909|nr:MULTISPECIES: AAA family ATPase [Gordonia]